MQTDSQEARKVLPTPDHPPSDPADHTEDFTHRWADVLDYLAGDRMGEGRALQMIHELTIGHLDPAAIRDRNAVAVRPLDEQAVAQLPGRVLRPEDRAARRLPDRPVARPGRWRQRRGVRGPAAG